MKFLKSSLYLLLGTFVFVSCKGGKDPSETAAKFIPKSSALVFSIDLGKLAQNQLTLSKVSGWAKSDEIKEKAAASGVDTTSRVFAFLSLTGSSIDEGMGGMLFSIADNEKFKLYLAEVGEVQEENGITFLENKDYFAASNGTFGIFLAGNSSFDLKAEGLTMFALKPEESVLGDEENIFALQQAEGYDLALWLNGYEFSKLSMKEEEAALLMSTLHLNEYYSSTILNFEPGEIVISGMTNGSDEFKETYTSFVPGSGVAASTSEVINGEDLSGYLGLKVNPKGFEQIAAIGEFKPMIDDALGKMGLEMSDILEALSGDVAASFNGMVEVEQEKVDRYAYLYDESIDENAEPEVKIVTEQMPDFTLAMGIADAEKLDKLMNIALLAAQGKIEKTEEGVYFHKESGLSFFEKNGNMVLAFAPTKEKITSGKVVGPETEVVSNLSAYPAYYYFDIELFLQQLSKASPEAAMGIGMGKQYLPFKSLKGYSTSDNNYSSKLVITMMDAEKNSLLQIVEKVDSFMNGFGQMMKGMM